MRKLCLLLLPALILKVSAYATEITVGGKLTTIVAADMDGVNGLDLVTGLHDATPGQVIVLLNDGTGGFTQAAYTIAGGGTLKKPGIAIGDLDGDGDNDVVVGNDEGSSVFVFLNNGNGTLVVGTSLTIPNATKASAVAIGDFDGQNKLDIAVLAKEGTSPGARIYLSNDTGTYTGAYSVASVTAGSKPAAIVAGDFVTGGRIDLAVATEGGNTALILINNGSGVFTAGTPIGVSNKPKSIAAADMNNDGKLDVIAPGEDGGTVSIRFGDGLGGLSGTDNYTAAGGKCAGVSAADLNDDGLVDVVTSDKDNSKDGISVFFNTGGGVLGTPIFFSTGVGSKGSGVTIAQLNGTGRVDIASCTEAGKVHLFFAVNAPTLTSLSPATIPVFTTGAQLTVTGTNFTTNCTIVIDGVAVTTNFLSATQLSTGGNIDARLAAAGLVPVKVITSDTSFPPESGIVNLTVSKATPTVTWNPPTSITYGEALSAAQLNASSPVSGTYSYTPGIGTLLNAGDDQSIALTYTPTDSANYNSVSRTILLDVLKRPLEVTADNKIKFVGQTQPKFTATFTGLAFFDSPTELPVVFTLPPGIDTNVPDEYTVSVALDANGQNGTQLNYSIAFKAGILSVLSPASVIANSIGSNELKDDSVGTSELADGVVITGKLADDAVISQKLAEADGSSGQNTNAGSGVKTGHIQDGAVTVGAIGAGGKIASGTASGKAVLTADGNGGAAWLDPTLSLPSGMIIQLNEGAAPPPNATLKGVIKQKVQFTDPTTKKKKNVAMVINVYQIN